MAKAILGKVPKLKNIKDTLISGQVTIAQSAHAERLRSIVGSFETNIPIIVDNSLDGDTFTTHIGPDETATTTNAMGQTVRTADLLFWLDQGTSVRYAVMPDDFRNETFPGSLDTRGVAYNREGIYININDPKPGIAARNYMYLINENYKNLYLRRMKQFLKNALDNV
jgi:hypothetical protein